MDSFFSNSIAVAYFGARISCKTATNCVSVKGLSSRCVTPSACISAACGASSRPLATTTGTSGSTSRRTRTKARPSIWGMWRTAPQCSNATAAIYSLGKETDNAHLGAEECFITRDGKPTVPGFHVEHSHENLIKGVIDAVSVVKGLKGFHILLLAPPSTDSGEQQEDQGYEESSLNFVLNQHL